MNTYENSSNPEIEKSNFDSERQSLIDACDKTGEMIKARGLSPMRYDDISGNLLASAGACYRMGEKDKAMKYLEIAKQYIHLMENNEEAFSIETATPKGDAEIMLKSREQMVGDKENSYHYYYAKNLFEKYSI